MPAPHLYARPSAADKTSKDVDRTALSLAIVGTIIAATAFALALPALLSALDSADELSPLKHAQKGAAVPGKVVLYDEAGGLHADSLVLAGRPVTTSARRAFEYHAIEAMPAQDTTNGQILTFGVSHAYPEPSDLDPGVDNLVMLPSCTNNDENRATRVSLGENPTNFDYIVRTADQSILHGWFSNGKTRTVREKGNAHNVLVLTLATTTPDAYATFRCDADGNWDFFAVCSDELSPSGPECYRTDITTA